MQIESLAQSAVISFSSGHNKGGAGTPLAALQARRSATPSGEVNIESSVHAIAEALGSQNIMLDFSQDGETGVIVIRLIDQSTGETLRQIPADVLLHLSAVLGKLQGRIFDRQV